jgi:hypothetical protein
MDEFNFKRNIPNEQESWAHTPLIPRPLRLQRYTHELRCKNGFTPQQLYDALKGQYVVKRWNEPTHQHFLIRDGNLRSLKGLLPPSHNINNPPLGSAD